MDDDDGRMTDGQKLNPRISSMYLFISFRNFFMRFKIKLQLVIDKVSSPSMYQKIGSSEVTRTSSSVSLLCSILKQGTGYSTHFIFKLYTLCRAFRTEPWSIQKIHNVTPESNIPVCAVFPQYASPLSFVCYVLPKLPRIGDFRS